MAQLLLNLSVIVLAGILTLAIERWLYRRRRAAHRDDPARAVAGLPTGRAAASQRQAPRGKEPS